MNNVNITIEIDLHHVSDELSSEIRDMLTDYGRVPFHRLGNLLNLSNQSIICTKADAQMQSDNLNATERQFTIKVV